MRVSLRRTAALALAGSAMLGMAATVSCSSGNGSTPPRTQPPLSQRTAAPPPSEEAIAVEPKLLLLPSEQMLAGKWTMSEGDRQFATVQASRQWLREFPEARAAEGSYRVGITTRLYRSSGESRDDFLSHETAGGAMILLKNEIIGRGVPETAIKLTEIGWNEPEMNDQTAWKVEFCTSRSDCYVEYRVYLHLLNTRALIIVAAEAANGTEPAKLAAEVKEVVTRQATLLKSQPRSKQLVPTIVPVTPAPSATPTP